jgi:hypothetical protein
MFDSFNSCLIVVRYGFNLVFVFRMVLDVRLNWLYDVKKVKRHPIYFPREISKLLRNTTTESLLKESTVTNITSMEIFTLLK